MPSATSLDGRVLQSTSEGGRRAGDGGDKGYTAVGTPGQLLGVATTPANAQERDQVGKLCERVRTVAGQAVQVGFGDQGHTGQEAEYAAAARAIDWRVVKEPEGQTGLVLLPLRWVVERSFAWLSRLRWLIRDCERLSSTLQHLRSVVFAHIMLARHTNNST